jgi:hypothetical protein
MFTKWPPFALFQVETFGGVESGELLIPKAPDAWWRNRSRRAIHLT